MMMPQRQRIAYHEAGHAVVQTMIGRGRFMVSEVSLHEGTLCVGDGLRQQGCPLLDCAGDLNLYELGLAALSGIAAEHRRFEDDAPAEEDRRWETVSDMAEWKNVCRRHYPAECRVRLMGLNVMRKLDEIFAEPKVWRVVEGLAGRLLEKDVVAGEELHRILAGLSGLVTGQAG
jgi:hypothetical protein